MASRRAAVLWLLVFVVGACGSTVRTTGRAAQRSAGQSELGSSDAAGTAVASGEGPTASPAASSRPGAVTTRPAAGSGVAANGRTDHSPIKIGMLSTNNDAAPSAGVDNGNTFTSRRAFEAFVAAFNKRGGLGGRRIDAVYTEIRSSSTTTPADLQAACDGFTSDDHVAAVFAAVGLYSEAFSQCLAKAGTPLITGDYAFGDADSIAQAPSVIAVSGLTIDDRMRALLERGSAAKRLTKTDPLGVVIEGCPFNVRAYNRTVVPTANRLGIPIADHIESRCFESFADFGGLASDMASAALRLRTRGATRILFVSGSLEGNLVLLFATAAESQGWHPGYAITSTAAPVVQEANTPKTQLANAFGLGWLPSIDSTQSKADSATTQGCLRDLNAGAGITPASATDRYFAFSICDIFAIYDQVLQSTRGATDRTAITRAVSGLDTRFAAAATLGGATDFGGGRRTGPAQGRLFAWSTTCGCFAYTGNPFGLTGN